MESLKTGQIKKTKTVTLSDFTAPRRQVYLRLSGRKLKKHYPHPKFTLNPKYYRKAWKDIEKNYDGAGI